MCAPIPAASPPEPQRASSSAKHRVGDVVAALPPYSRSELQAQVARAARTSAKTSLGNQCASSHSARVRAQLGGDEPADRLAQLLVLGGERRGGRRLRCGGGHAPA